MQGIKLSSRLMAQHGRHVQQVSAVSCHQEGLLIMFSLLGLQGGLQDFLERLEVSKEEVGLWTLGDT